MSVDPDFEGAACERLLAQVGSTADPAWRQLAALLWPEVARLVRKSRGMTVLAHSEDHVRNATLLALEKLGKHDCRAAHFHGPWRAAHPDATLDDWLRIVTTNVVRDYVREQSGRGARRSRESSKEAAPGGAPAIVMELLAGHSLQRRFDRGPMPLGDLCHVLGRVAAALGAAHAAGVVHRDLKPENVFLARTAGGGVDVKVLDFGVAKRTALASPQSSGNLTRTGALVGTPFYMSPEQVLGEDDVDARADIWALGVMLYEGLSGVLPTRADNLGQVIKAVAMTPIAPIAQLVPGVPPELAELLVRLLSKARDGRPREMDEVRVALARHESESLAARLDLDRDPDLDRDVEVASSVVLPTRDASETGVFAPSRSFADAAPRAGRARIAALAAAVMLGAGGVLIVVASGARVHADVAPLPSTLIVASLAASQAPPTASASSGPQPLSVTTAHPAPRGEGRARPPPVLVSAPSPAPPPIASSGIGVEREL